MVPWSSRFIHSIISSNFDGLTMEGQKSDGKEAANFGLMGVESVRVISNEALGGL